jgi:dihydropteroate synthase
MGILNVTPDSFSDGGDYLDPEAALAHALEMAALGADIIDVGGQSTRPGYEAVPWEEEWARLKPVLPGLAAAGLTLSVDTFYPQVAQKALEAGARIINDVSGFGDEMLRAVAGSGCGCVVMHPRGSGGGGILEEVRAFFLERREAAAKAGIGPERLCFDPGIGFGKTVEENLLLMAQVGRTKLPDSAYLMAASRKRVTGAVCGNPPFRERLAATLAAHTAAVLGGADLVRVHDVKEAAQAAKMADALKEAKNTHPSF